jgi:hypothetical protein
MNQRSLRIEKAVDKITLEFIRRLLHGDESHKIWLITETSKWSKDILHPVLEELFNEEDKIAK